MRAQIINMEEDSLRKLKNYQTHENLTEGEALQQLIATAYKTYCDNGRDEEECRLSVKAAFSEIIKEFEAIMGNGGSVGFKDRWYLCTHYNIGILRETMEYIKKLEDENEQRSKAIDFLLAKQFENL